jgi:hypothetical protein
MNKLLLTCLMLCVPGLASAATPEEIAEAQAQVTALQAQKATLQTENAADRQTVSLLNAQIALMETHFRDLKTLFAQLRKQSEEVEATWKLFNAKLSAAPAAP